MLCVLIGKVNYNLPFTLVFIMEEMSFDHGLGTKRAKELTSFPLVGNEVSSSCSSCSHFLILIS